MLPSSDGLLYDSPIARTLSLPGSDERLSACFFYKFTEKGTQMAYDATKDQVIEKWENDETGLCLSINRYGDGEPKLQVGPRIYIKRDGKKSTTKPGRLSIEDVIWLNEVIEEIIEKMNSYFLEES